jgi:hypothetical protein
MNQLPHRRLALLNRHRGEHESNRNEDMYRMLAVKGETRSAPPLGADWASYADRFGDTSLSGSVTVPDS